MRAQRDILLVEYSLHILYGLVFTKYLHPQTPILKNEAFMVGSCLSPLHKKKKIGEKKKNRRSGCPAGKGWGLHRP